MGICVCQEIKFDFHPSPVTHFQYADDIVLFIKNDAQVIRGMKKVLLLFHVITGLSINFSKSVVYHAYDENSTRACKEIFGCQLGQLPFIYLGDWVGLEKKTGLNGI